MASVKYITKGKTNSIYLRFTNGNMFDVTSSTNITIPIEYWDSKNQKIKNVIAVPNRDEINAKLLSLKLHVLNQFNTDYTNGQTIDSKWLKSVINGYFNRPKEENRAQLIYLTEFAQDWLDNKAPKYKVSSTKLMDETTIGHYQSVVDVLKEYEGKNKIKLLEVDGGFFDSVSLYLTDEKNYASKTAKRKISRIKFFCARAEEDNIKVNQNYKARFFVQQKTEEYKMPYLNEDEIDRVFNYGTDSQTLASVRDNWIIGLRTGLRVSDFLTRLDVSNINGDFIEIRTKKTGTSVAIPLHEQVKKVLKRNNGLPPKISEQKFNFYIKEISEQIGFVKKMKGAIMINGRKKVDTYPKHRLVTSHICRRSFCTNLLGKVPNQVIMAVAGWSSEKQMYQYCQKTNMEFANTLKEHWENGRK